jgi:phage gpG-like protein
MPNLRGLRLDEGILAWEFRPSLGIMAKNIDKLGIDIRSFREPLRRAIKQVMIPSFKKNFAVEGRPAWEPLAEDTVHMRELEGSGSGILDRTGNLKRNMGYTSMWTITQEFAAIRDLPQRIWYGKVHQEGQGGMGHRIKAEHAAAKKRGEKIDAKEAGKRAMLKLDADIKSGNSGSSVNIPPRPFVVFQEEDMDGVYEVFEVWLTERLEKALLRGRL